MKIVCFVLLLTAVTVSSHPLWEKFKADYKREYRTVKEEAQRMQCFSKNLELIDLLNSKQSSVLHGINKFADICSEEFKIFHNGRYTKKVGVKALFSAKDANKTKDAAIDWRQKGAVTPIKDQGQCGSCWSFSATGNMEGQHFLATGTLVGLSEEELVQCSTNDGNQGCNGGTMDAAFDWVASNGGITTEADYPYTSGNGITGKCQLHKLKNVTAIFTGHKDIPSDEAQMAAWVLQNGPLSVAVDASSGWQTYMGGIVTTCNGTSLDHGVLIVGLGTEQGTPYWIVKNQWGATWGENGYIRLQRGTNQCGINSNPSTAVVVRPRGPLFDI